VRGKNMKDIKNKAQKNDYLKMGEFFDDYNIADNWENKVPVNFDVDIQTEIIYYRIDKNLSQKVQKIAQKRGISADTLINLWIQDKINNE
jgi:hypothetical protein